MIDVRDTHRQAMERADQAVAAQRAGGLEEATTLFREACRLESAAAHALIDELGAEPTRSVLFRSAASLAVEARQFAYAAYLVARGLEGSPPQEIRDELRSLLSTIRPETELEALSNQEFRPRDRVGRYLASCAQLRTAADRVRTALAVQGLEESRLSGPLSEQLVISTENSLREFVGDGNLWVGLFAARNPQMADWLPVPPLARLPEFWTDFAVAFLEECGDALLAGSSIVGQIRQLTRERVFSEQCFTAAERAGIRALAGDPVRAIDENQVDRPAFVLLALASQETAFVDELAREILSDAVSLLEIVVQIGWRDEVSEPRDLGTRAEDA
jgi:hypothetical protein